MAIFPWWEESLFLLELEIHRSILELKALTINEAFQFEASYGFLTKVSWSICNMPDNAMNSIYLVL